MTDQNEPLDPEEVLAGAAEAIRMADEILDDYPQSAEIRGKVVGFVNTREVIMSVGSADGVKVGMQFAIMVPGGVPVSVDEGDEPLGNIDVAKAIVKVVRINGDHLSIGRTFMTIKGRPATDIRETLYGSGGILDPSRGGLLDYFGKRDATPDRVETFDVGRSQTVGADIDLTVRRGDEVRLTTGDEFIFPG